MKRITLFLLLLIFSFSATHLYAQSVKTGAKAGISFTNFHDTDADYDNRSGYMIGGFVKMNFPMSPISIQPEVYYSQKGAETGSGEIKLEYIEVPILFKIGLLGGQGPINPNIFVGPYAGINLNESSQGLLGGTDNTETVDFGGVIGGGFDFEAGSAIFTIDARYSFGLSPAFKSGDEKNSVFAIVAGISLPS